MISPFSTFFAPARSNAHNAIRQRYEASPERLGCECFIDSGFAARCRVQSVLHAAACFRPEEAVRERDHARVNARVHADERTAGSVPPIVYLAHINARRCAANATPPFASPVSSRVRRVTTSPAPAFPAHGPRHAVAQRRCPRAPHRRRVAMSGMKVCCQGDAFRAVTVRGRKQSSTAQRVMCYMPDDMTSPIC